MSYLIFYPIEAVVFFYFIAAKTGRHTNCVGLCQIDRILAIEEIRAATEDAVIEDARQNLRILMPELTGKISRRRASHAGE
ncbi:hypothetical protein NUBL22018_49010 [Klebsiella variicola]|nr:hypothetical protein NUBL22018_49010 [Klebsiella variicola]GKK40810.1 hypothetical protein NUKP39_44680 [Klebsiella variicola]